MTGYEIAAICGGFAGLVLAGAALVGWLLGNWDRNTPYHARAGV